MLCFICEPIGGWGEECGGSNERCLRHLNTWFLVGDATGGGYGTFRRLSLVGESTLLGGGGAELCGFIARLNFLFSVSCLDAM